LWAGPARLLAVAVLVALGGGALLDGGLTVRAAESEAAPAAPAADAAAAAPAEAPAATAEAAAPAAPTNADCMSCHGDPSAASTNPDGSPRSLYVDQKAFEESIHGSLDCTSCHADITEVPHEADLKSVDCGTCHGDEMKAYQGSLHATALQNGDHDAASCKDCHGTHDMRPSTDPLSRTNPARLVETCGACHSDPVKMKKHMVSVMHPSDAYMKSTHAQAVAQGKHAATCNECHGTHDLLPSNNPASTVYRDNIANTCGKCHAKERDEFDKSIHGKALKAGIKDAPTCTDCHGEHDIEGPGSATSAVNRKQVSRETCPRCHDDERVMSRYGIEVMRQASYMDSYHGMASAAGSKVVADCTDCHGVHSILPRDDEQSSINKKNLPQTCGKCHEGANENFANGPVHIIPTSPGQKALGIVRLVYIWLIALTIGGMVGHNTLMMARHAVTKLHKERRRGPGVYRRFNKGQTIGHLVLTVAFIVLTISGFALRFPESWVTRYFFFGDTGLALRSVVHRIAAVLLVSVTVANMLYIILTRGGRKELGSLMLRFRDGKDAFHNMLYFLGIAKHPPKFDRYSYSEKFEYWGLWWGSALMIATGFMMWFPDYFMRFFPKIGLDIAALIHYYEAWLAFLTIVIWHMYYMIFAPDTYPMNWSWITGNITEEDFKERHPLEFEREVLGEGKDEEEKGEGAAGDVVPGK
jgi:cytochrome b subunit of formate dehydrogenase